MLNKNKPDSVDKPVKTEEKAYKASKKGKRRSFPIIAMGGSAGSFSAFEKFFSHMPSDSGMCFIVIMHLDPEHKGNVSQLFEKYTRMPVAEAEDGLVIEPDKVYVIPPNKDMGMHNGKLLLFPPAAPKGFRLPIDYFFQSVAEDQWNRVVGIIFSGMGSDGETGLRMIKEKLGMAMVQDPETAQYNSMPMAAIGTNLVDYVASPEEMPLKLIQYLNHPILADDLSEEVLSEIKNANAIHKILMLLRSHVGHDFSLYKKNTITRRIDRRIAFHQLPDYGQYVVYLRDNPHEIDVLFHELLIGVTKFFRDEAAFDALKDKLFSMLRQKTDSSPIRVWAAGCSTGEEAYSIAIIIMEYLSMLNNKSLPKVQIFATDLDMDAIEVARAGVYHKNIMADVSEERIEKYFIKKKNTYSVRKELREMIVFAQHNIIKDAPFTRLDLLICRNVMIYLTTDLQKKIIPIFHYSLNPKGIYFMGPAETLGGFSDMFMPLNSRWKLFERKEGPAVMGKMIDFPFNVSQQLPNPQNEDPYKSLPKKTILADAFNQVLIENYTPPSVLINAKDEIVHINGKTNNFLKLKPGQATMNINRMAREEFKYALNNAIHQVRLQKGTIKISNIRLKDSEGTRTINLLVTLLDNGALKGLILVIFEDNGLLKISRAGTQKGKPGFNAAGEPEKGRQLHITIEQMETSLGELKSTNEELQSTNEELHSTNEEALTINEEMQSLNEELTMINAQYQAKAEELTQLNNDMKKNMLDNTEIGTIFLDNKLDILSFTPQIKKLFNIIATDVGRSITHLASNFKNFTIKDDIQEVIEKLIVKELELETKNGDWYNLRIMPYRTIDNFINGAVLIINRITTLKDIEKKLLGSESAVRSLIDSLPDAVLILDANQIITVANKAFFSKFHIKEQDVSGQSFGKLAQDRWKTNKLDEMLKQCNHEPCSLALEHDFPVIGLKKLEIRSSPTVNMAPAGNWAIVTITEI